jgi:hypothetical protein
MHDLPHGPALLRLAREVLLDELLPLLPEERRLDARLVANAMAVAERGAEVSFVPILTELQGFYGEGTHGICRSGSRAICAPAPSRSCRAATARHAPCCGI